MKPKLNWYSLKNSTTDSVEVDILDEIGGWGIDASTFISDLNSHKGKSIKLTINSPGGSVFDGVAIYNFVRANFKDVTTEVIGLAASIASIIFLAGSRRIVNDGTFVMIHNPWTVAVGDSEEMRKLADTMDKIAEELVAIYAGTTGLDREMIKAMMADETWFGADEAVAHSFATEVGGMAKVAAMIKPEFQAKFKNPPKDLKVTVDLEVEVDDSPAPEAPAEPAQPYSPVTEPAPESGARIEISNHAKEIKNMDALDQIQDASPDQTKTTILANAILKPDASPFKGMKFKEFVNILTTSGTTPKEIQEILDVVAEANPMRRIATVLTIKGDGVVPYAGLATTTWGTEGATLTVNDPTITTVSLGAFSVAGRFQVTDAMMEDDFINVAKLIKGVVGGSLAEAEATAMFGSGAGSDRPQGIFNHAIDTLTATTGTFVKQDLLDFIDSLETKYRSGNECLVLSPSVLAKVRGLQDASKAVDVDSANMRINGIPYVLTSLAPAWATTANTKIIAYGDFKRGYAIAQRGDTGSLIKSKLIPAVDAFAENVLFAERIDGRIVIPGAFKVLAIK